MNPLFSQYKGGENRTTSTIIAVLERLNLSVVQAIFRGILETSEMDFISFNNQEYLNPESEKKPSTIDATIKSSPFGYYIEAKTKIDTGLYDQLDKYYKKIKGEENAKLIALTPDNEAKKKCPNKPEEYPWKDEVAWVTYKDLVDTIISILDYDASSISDKRGREENIPQLTEVEKFLLNELIYFIEADNSLIPDTGEDRVIVVAAGYAYGFYEAYGSYCCQANRSFRPSRYLAFYRKKQIEKKVCKIIGYIDEVDGEALDWDMEGKFTEDDINKLIKADQYKSPEGSNFSPDDLKKAIKATLDTLNKMKERKEKNKMDEMPIRKGKMFLLEELPEDKSPQNVIKHEEKGAFTQEQRYVSYEKLQKAKITKDLID